MLLARSRKSKRFQKCALLRMAAGWLTVLTLSVGCSQSTAPLADVHSRNGMVVSVCHVASQVGADTLRKGGNAVDSAVAVAFALAATYPPAGNIGGGGFMLVYPEDGREPTCIDYRETAPAAATPNMLAYSAQTDAKMVGVPGTVRGLALAHEKYGRLSWKELLLPAIQLAEYGFPVNAALARSLNNVLHGHPKMAGLQAVYAPRVENKQWSPGDRLIQPELARTLRLIADVGPTGFYEGPIAKQIVAEVRAGGGVMSRADLAGYRAILREPIRGTYRGYEIVAAPPPSSGGVALVQMLNMLEPFDLQREGRWSAGTLHLLIECMRRAYRDRAEYLGDPDFVEVPGHLIEKSYARHLAESIDLNHATSSESLAGPIPIRDEGNSTTHFSIMDKNGMAVSNTYTLEQSYGSKIVVRGAGFLLNNELGDFNRRPGVTDRTGRVGTPPNLLAPHKRMVSAQTPAIVARDGKVVLVTGSPGGRTIINTVLCVLLNSLEYEMNSRDAVDAPRMHHQWFPDEVMLEPGTGGVSPETLKQLRAMGHIIRLENKDGTRYVQGDAHSIFIRNGIFYGVADRRIHGGASGY